jgi:hypothetical protein
MKLILFTLLFSLAHAQSLPEMDVKNWTNGGRAKTLAIFANEVYGKVPSGKVASEWALDRESLVFDGKVHRREYVLTLGGKLKVRALAYIPVTEKKVPAFLGLNFKGNHSVEVDEWITKTNDGARGENADRWPVKLIADAGFAVITIHCDDFDPDEDDGFENGVHALFSGERTGSSWGTVAGWAWGLSRVLDHLSEVSEIDETKVAVIGHSRLGKTALWAGASDERFAMVISNNSGCGGAALSKRKHGETVGRINKAFPHWFAGNFKKYDDKEENLPVDQHQLIACVAPRPVYVASASGDDWADPEGEFLALKGAAPVYALWQESPFPVDSWSKPGEAVGTSLMNYHIREGKHDIQAWDWERYLAAAKILQK